MYLLRSHISEVLVLCLFVISTAMTSQAQAVAAGAGGSIAAATTAAAPVPPVKGFNFSLNNLSQHSSVTGWSSLMTPDLSYRFNPHFFVDANFPWYLDVQNFVQTKVAGVTTYPLKQSHNLIGDTTASGHFGMSAGDFGYSASATVGLATGDSKFGLSANTTTYNLNNHFEYSIGPFTPDVEIGNGNSSSLAHSTAKKSYTAVGQMAFFQAGTNVDLPFKMGLDLEAYEAMPIGNQNVYGTVTTKNKKGKTVTKQVLQGTGPGEDNGFNAELDVPLSANFSLAGNYQRSLRQATDIAGIGITWVLRTPKKQAK